MKKKRNRKNYAGPTGFVLRINIHICLDKASTWMGCSGRISTPQLAELSYSRLLIFMLESFPILISLKAYLSAT